MKTRANPLQKALRPVCGNPANNGSEFIYARLWGWLQNDELQSPKYWS